MEPLRVMGLVHRVKRTKDNEEHPTLVHIRPLHAPVRLGFYELKNETDELDFLTGRFVTEYRKVREDDDLAQFYAHQIKWKPVKDATKLEGIPVAHQRKVGKTYEVIDAVPASYDGLCSGDVISMCLGGSGDHLVYAMTRHGQDIGAKVVRLTPKLLKERRGDADKAQDHVLLAKLYIDEPGIFQEAQPTDLALIEINKMFNSRMDSQKERIKCEQRLQQRLRDRVFLSHDGVYPDVSLEDRFASEKANDVILQSLIAEENRRDRELEKAVASHPLYEEIFKKVRGVGVRIAAPLIAYIGDIRRFDTSAGFKMYCGAAPDKNGKFLRKTKGVQISWRGEIRQSLFLFVDQMNRAPESEWGQKFRAQKLRLRQVHPEPELVQVTDAKGNAREELKHTNLHIHNNARWHTLGQFCEWLYGEWKNEVAKQEAKAVANESNSDVAAA